MLGQLLDLFPANTHSLFLASDPDGLLADEAVLSVLSQRGFQIVRENDPILFRYRVEQLKPFTITNPLLAITDGTLEDLPYDLWQQGQRVQIALHQFFPTLAYPIVRALSPIQRSRLSQVKQPNEHFGNLRTIQFLLDEIFNFNISLMHQPSFFVLWLDEFHQSLAPFPSPILEYVLEQLGRSANYEKWNLKDIIKDRNAFREFLQGQWREYLMIQSGNRVGESDNHYLLHFESSQGLQDALPRLLRNGSLTPVQMDTQTAMPSWVVPGVLILDEDPRPRRVMELDDLLKETLVKLTDETRWEEWQAIAYQWAEITILRNDLDLATFDGYDYFKKFYSQLDDAFTKWLAQKYSSLATQSLPLPHHVHHIPHYLHYLRSQGKVHKVALLVMDGMSLTDWLLLRQKWQSPEINWRIQEKLVLAQIPTITAISRHALISGLRPADFYIPNGIKLTEAKAWSAFWVNRELPENAIALVTLRLEKNDPTPEITNPRLQALCMVERQLDEIMHKSLLGPRDHQSRVKLWLDPTNPGLNSSKLEKVINLLLDERFTVFLASDHGHCESTGIGKPNEGLMAQSRGRRARLYTDRRSAEQTQTAFNNTVIWENDGLLPKDLFALLPKGRQAFTEHEETVITHGGITIDEIVVPLIQINRK